MSDQQGFPDPFGDDGSSGNGAGGGGPEGPDKRGVRGRTIAIIVLSIAVVVLILVVASLVFAEGTKIQPTASPIVTPTEPSTSPTPSPTPTPTTTDDSHRCTVDDLSVTLGQFNGTAGSEYVPIQFTNTSSSPCDLHGFPGVSFVGKGNGTQLGAAADWDTSKPIVQNTLQPNATVVANLQIAFAGNYDASECQPLAADGLRIYPPHSTQSVFVKTTNQTACQNSSVHLLTVTTPVAPQK